MAHLNRYKRFPPGAAGAGVATGVFTIDRSGRVLSARLVRSAGDSALDTEAASLPRRASHLPAPPPNIGGPSITLAVPISSTDGRWLNNDRQESIRHDAKHSPITAKVATDRSTIKTLYTQRAALPH
jgi:TonB family protein